MNELESRIRKEVSKSPLTVSRVYKSDFQKEGTMTAELKQTVTTKSFYPSKSVANSLQDNIFSAQDFGFQEHEYESAETRVAWIDVPVGSTLESIQTKLAMFPEANLYRILSNKPIISISEDYAINSPALEVTLDTFAARQAVRYPMGAENEGQLATDSNNKIQYRRVAFAKAAMEDKDLRTADPEDSYISEELKAELNGVTYAVADQSI